MTIDRTTVGDDRGERVEPFVGLTDLDRREWKGNPHKLNSPQEHANLQTRRFDPRPLEETKMRTTKRIVQVAGMAAR